MIKLYLTIILFLVLTSCTTIRPNLILESGRPVANPNYVLNDCGVSQLKVTFWYTVYTEIKDLDKTIIYIPNVVDQLTYHELNDTIKKVALNIEVYNPKNVEYTLSYKLKTRINNDGSTVNVIKSKIAGESDLTYRAYEIRLPFNNNILTGEIVGQLKVDDMPIFIIGPMRYGRKIIIDGK